MTNQICIYAIGITLADTEHADADGEFRRKPSTIPSTFRSSVSSNPSSEFPAQKDHYVLYLGYCCRTHGTRIVRTLKELEDIIERGFFSGRFGSAERDTLYRFMLLKELYLKADPQYEGRYTNPILWDKQRQTIVNNEAARSSACSTPSSTVSSPRRCERSTSPLADCTRACAKPTSTP
ncbi:glutathione S-transferase omega-like 2 [Aspergillus lentulus]|nr:glutathione S-transferase omega-like 2 [Aspergillus lentulus]GFF88665.1 glutathione S-transferase omega-like 2 [Aspergillus lentulus]